MHSPTSVPAEAVVPTLTPQKLLLGAAIVAAALVASAAHAPRASAATPCWKLLLTDWYDGRIDNTYPIHCYTDALKHLPPDVATYSSAHDDIERALATAKLELKKSGKTVTPNTLVPPNNGGNTQTKTTTTKSGTATTTTATGTTSTSPGKQSQNAIDQLNPNSPSSVPLPLLVLGGLALLLVAAGAAGLIAKRYQNRKNPPAT